MSELTKNQLKQDNTNSFPNNNSGLITPAVLRDFNNNMIDSLVDEVTYTQESASFDSRINDLDPSGSQQNFAALEAATASLNAYTASQNSFNSSATASIVALQSFSSSLDATFATDAQLTTLSASIAVTDNAQSASIAQLQQFSSSLDSTYATDAQLTSLSSSIATTDLAQSASIAALQQFSSSLDATFATDAQLSASVSALSSSVAVTDLAQSASIAALQSFSSSLDATFATDAQLSASVAALSSSVAVTDLAQSQSIAQLLGFSSSLDNTFATDAQLNAATAALQLNINTKLNTSSYQTDSASFDSRINGIVVTPFLSQSVFNSYTASNDSKVNSLIAATSSYAISSSVAAINAGQDSKINSLISVTGSYATTGSNTFNGSQNIIGALTASSINATSASFQYVQTVFETASVIYSSGSNQLGDELSDVQTLSGSVKIQGTLLVNGLPVSTSSFDASGYLLTSSFNTYTASASTAVSGAINSATQSLSSSIAVTTNNLDLEVNQKLDSASFNSYTASNDSKVNSLISATGSYVTEAESGSFVTSVLAGGTPKQISVTKGNGTTNTITINNVDSASFATTASFALNVTPIDTSSLVTTSSFNSYTASASTAVSGAINSATQSLSSSIAVTTNNLDLKANGKLDSSSFNSYTASNDSKVNSLIAATGSYAISSSVATITGNSLVTASISGDTITFTKGNGSTFPIVVPTGSGGSVPTGTVSSSAQIAAFGYATTGSNTFNGGQNIAGTLDIQQASNPLIYTSIIQDSLTNRLTLSQGGADGFRFLGDITASGYDVIADNFIGTASYASQALSASFAQTASFLLGSVASASFATSASYAVTASYSQNVIVTARNQNASTLGAGTVVRIVDAVGDNPIFNTASFQSESLSSNTLGVLRNSIASGADGDVVVIGTVLGVNTDPALGYVAGDLLYLSSSGQFTRVQPQAPDNIVVIGEVLRAQQNNGSIFVNISNGWELNELHNVRIVNPSQGNLLAYNSGSALWENSSSAQLGLATTSSNVFVGNQIISASLYVRGGDVNYISNNTTLNPDLYLTESLAGQVNIIKGWGENPNSGGAGATQANYTGSLRITGSNNTVAMPQIRATGLGGGADQQGYISGSDNVIAGNSAGIFLNTGSQLFPKISNNQISNQALISMNFTTSSLSGGHPIIQLNTINAGSITLNSNSGSVQAVSTNIVNAGGLTSTQNFVTNVRPTITSNIINGNQVTINHISSSTNLQTNIINSPVTINNHLSSSGITTNQLNFNSNAVFGGSTATGLGVWVSGSQSSNAARTIIDNLIGGKNNIVSSSFVSSSNSSLVASLIYGQNLVVNGNNATTSGGSTFVGRFNDSGSLANSQDIVFAVGTGIAAGTRRTGLWIDSGSNTTISGSLSSKGNSAFSGSVDVSGSTTTLQNLGGIALAVRSGSVEVTSPQGTGYFYSNLPMTSSGLRINGTGLVSDLIVSGVFSGNSSLQVLGNSSFTGSVFTSASVSGVVNPLTISSQTASLDFSKGNFFTVQLVSGSSTHISPTNIAAGQTISLRLNTTGSGTVTFASSIKQASGSAYVPTTTTGVDVLTLITFDTSDVYISNLKNFS